MFDDYLSKFPKPGSPEAIRQLKIAAVISVFVIAIFSFLLIYGKVKLNAAPEQTFQAEVVEKSAKKRRNGGTRRLLVFEISNGEKKYFVNSKFFDDINEGDEGTLIFKETVTFLTNDSVIVSFEKE